MFGYEPVQHEYHYKFPKGALKTAEDLVAALDEIAESGQPMSLYYVTQSGHLDTFVLRHDTMVLNEDIMGVSVHRLVNTDGRYLFLGDIGVGGDGMTPAHESHRAFFNINDAIQYSLWMKTDPMYIESVRHWHRYCDRLENALDKLFGFDDSGSLH